MRSKASTVALRTITTARTGGGEDCVPFTTTLNHDQDGLKTTAGNATTTSSTYTTVERAELCE